jgi:hypothetical protein
MAAHACAGLAVRVTLGSPLGAETALLTDPAVRATAQIAAAPRRLLVNMCSSDIDVRTAKPS